MDDIKQRMDDLVDFAVQIDASDKPAFEAELTRFMIAVEDGCYKELRKLLNAAWNRARYDQDTMPYPFPVSGWGKRIGQRETSRRYRDVSKIIKKARQNRKPYRITTTANLANEENDG